MNRQIRKVAYGLLLAFGLLLGNLVWIQLVRAERLATHDANTRLLLREYAIERGAILSADGETLALSEERPGSELKFLRTYPTARLFAHITGYYSVRFGRTGLERSRNDALLGKGGVITMQDLGDRLLGQGETGDTLVLTIDSRVQRAAAEALGRRKGSVVALDPATGDILALYSFPTFDPNPLSQHSGEGQEQAYNALVENPDNPLLNRAAQETYFPGSTFKVVTASAAISHGRGPATSYPATRSYQPPQTDRPITNFGGASCGGNMTQALRASCNTYFARLAAETEAEDFEETVRGFGFGEVPPIDLRAVASNLPSEEQLASPAFRALAGIGQFEVSATPLQMALVAATVANEGRVPVPKLVREIRGPDGRVVEQVASGTWREATTPQVAGQVKEMMTVAVERGFARTVDLPGLTVAGKTGTAETGRPDESVHVWVIAFAPAANPRIAVAVVLEGVPEGSTGSTLAGPIARRVMQAQRQVAGW